MSLPDVVRPLLGRFAAEAGAVLPLTALWAHGSLALGDYQPGRSDLDLVALVDAAPSGAQEQDLLRVHQALHREVPLAAKLHCSYVVAADLADPGRGHLTWAHGELFERAVSPVTRRELCLGGLSLRGPDPAAVVPPVSDGELAEYVRGDLRDYWYEKTAMPALWLQDIWVDLGLLTFARATVTLREGRLITKREALDVLADLGAPRAVVSDIFDRRYADPAPSTESWRTERGEQARCYLREAIRRFLALA